MSFTFTRYDSSNPRMNATLLNDVKGLLIATAPFHHVRDLTDDTNNNGRPFPDPYLLDLINQNRTGDVNGSGYNWMKVDYGTNDNTHRDFMNKGNVVIIYRLMQHRKRLVGRMQWSLTVGFDQSLLPDPDGSNQTENVYLQFAEILAGQIRKFRDDANLQPIDFIMIDDMPESGVLPSVSKVQTLLEIAFKYSADGAHHPDLYSRWNSRTEHIPHSEVGVRYYGYKKTDNDMIVTTITLLPPPAPPHDKC